MAESAEYGHGTYGGVGFGAPFGPDNPTPTPTGGEPQHAVGLRLQRENDDGSFSDIPNLTRIEPNIDRDSLETTNLSAVDAWRTGVVGNQGLSVAIEGNWDEAEPILEGLLDDATLGIKRTYQLFFPNDQRWAFVVHLISAMDFDGPEEDVITFTAQLETRGEPLFV